MTQPYPSAQLADRYGARAPWRRRVLLVVATLVAVVFLGWVAWAAWTHGTPAVDSTLQGFTVTGDHQVVATVHASVEDGAEATCRVRAFAEDHTVVGEASFTPTQGSNEVEVRTERRATSIELLGCTTPDQKRPR